MVTAGLYENSGDWLYETGLPGKSGVSGGMVAVSPGKGGLGVFAPRLDAAGNSVKGKLVARFLSKELGLNLFASKPRAAMATLRSSRMSRVRICLAHSANCRENDDDCEIKGRKAFQLHSVFADGAGFCVRNALLA
jgi:Glutaminase